MQNAVDLLDGGFFGKIDGLGKVIERSPKGVVLNCRILWSFSAAYIYSQEKAHLIHAQRAYDYLIMHFLDRENNGVIWEVDHKGNQLDGRKQIYAQAFAIYGFSIFYIASGQEESLQNAKQLFECIEKYSFDDVNNGYLECLTQDWKPISDMRLSQKDQNYPMTMNTHLHILEAYTSLYKVWKDKRLKDQLHTIIRIFLNRIIDRKRSHFQLFFDQDWSVQSNINSFGHNIEGGMAVDRGSRAIG